MYGSPAMTFATGQRPACTWFDQHADAWSAIMQLAAGAEHVIAGKTVRVNLAGPRPELPLLYMDPTQTQPMLIPQSTGKPACITSAA